MNLAISNVLTRKTSNTSSLENKGEECAQVDDSPYSSFLQKINRSISVSWSKALCDRDIYFFVKTAYVKQSQ